MSSNGNMLRALAVFAVVLMAGGYGYISAQGETKETVFLKEEISGGITFHVRDTNEVPSFLYAFGGRNYSTFTDEGIPFLARQGGGVFRFEGKDYIPASVKNVYAGDELQLIAEKYPEHVRFRYYDLPAGNENIIWEYEGIIVGRNVYYHRTLTEGFRYFCDTESSSSDGQVVFTHTLNPVKYVASCIVFPVVALIIALVTFAIFEGIWEGIKDCFSPASRKGNAGR